MSILEIAGSDGLRGGNPLDGLTPRQREVLHWIAEGFTNDEIAARLGIGVPRTARHGTDIFRRLGVRNRVEAAIVYHVWAAEGAVS